ncbi:hypothetical protein [Roseomonas sp. KE2513]|uniref:hypothetical protein n=1 Tax=Roseomonas sp. KE2513 TaxID=2479202 RepID=UPI001E335141|nr:hypothetical protein [Roseomonas sp. KE2513]
MLEVPTTREAGLDGLSLPMGALGLYAPAGIPAEMRNQIAAVLTRVVQTDADMQARLAGAGLNEGILTGEEYSARLLQERDFYAGLIRQAGIEPE